MSCAGRKQSHDSSEEAGEEKSSKDHWILGISRISQKEGGDWHSGMLETEKTEGSWSVPVHHPDLISSGHPSLKPSDRSVHISEAPKACLLHALTTSVSFYIPLQPSTHPLFWPRPLFIQPPPHFGPCPVLPQQIHPDGCQLSSMSTPLQKQLSQWRQAWAADVNQGSTVIN